LDIGAGVGKLCAIGAMSSSASWCGIEQHASLVDAARRLSRTLGVEQRTSFIHGDVFSIDWRDFDALYLYNPFELALFRDAIQARPEFLSQVARLEERLAFLAPGVRVVTLNGFGGVMPPTFDLLYQERIPIVGLDLVLWVQSPSSAGT
jgi:hypothetical protein